MSVILRFSKPATTNPPVNLLFDEAAGLGDDVVVRISGTLPRLTINSTFDVHLPPVEAEISGTLPGLTIAVTALIDLAVPSYLVARAGEPWRDGERVTGDAPLPWPPVENVHAGNDTSWRDGKLLSRYPHLPWSDAGPVRGYPPSMPWRDASLIEQYKRLPWRDAIPVRGYPPRLPWRDGTFVLRYTREPWQAANPVRNLIREPWRQGLFNLGRVVEAWRQGRFNGGWTREPWREAMVLESHGSPIIPPDPPVDEPCYVPSAILEFNQLAPAATELLFICESDLEPPDTTIVVPVRKVYMVFNTFTLRNVETDTYIACQAFNMSLDVDSYTWSFSGSIPRAEFSKVQRSSPEIPVELEAVINGVAYRFLMDKIGGDRQHGSFPSMRIQGRGLGAALDLLSGNYNNTDSARTAAQLMDDCLLVNGVGVDWTIDWQLTDWLVPQGAFAMQGTAVAALQSIVNAAGGYLQPDPVLKTLYALHKYPSAPWLWDLVVPDYELPTAVVTTEGMEWVDKPRYTRVFVAPTQGVITRVTRASASEILVAPTAVESIAATAVAGEQKGRTILSDTGRIVNTSLSLPVLAETGIIPPGKMIRYVEGLSEKLGITRAVSVSVTEGRTRQTLQVEIHE